MATGIGTPAKGNEFQRTADLPTEPWVRQEEIKAEIFTDPVPAPVVIAARPSYSGGTKYDWMREAGIPERDWTSVDFIISMESGWNPNATNAASGAHGLPQALPYSKTGCGWSDAICQLKWADGYAKSRYGSWYGSYVFWIGHRYW